MNPNQDFLGTGWAFPPTFVPGLHQVRLVSGADDILESLHILLTTTLGERLLHPTYGCDLRPYLFEPLNTTLTTFVKDLVETAILYHEPRVRPDDVSLELQPEQGLMLIRVDYIIRATNSRQNIVHPFYLREGSEVVA